MLSYAAPEIDLVYYRQLELQAEAACSRPEKQHPPGRMRPSPPRVGLVRSRQASMEQIALETLRP